MLSGKQGSLAVRKPNRFSITISRVNESANQDPDHTMHYSVQVGENGDLHIEGDHEDRVFSAGLWDSFTVSRLATPAERW